MKNKKSFLFACIILNFLIAEVVHADCKSIYSNSIDPSNISNSDVLSTTGGVVMVASPELGPGAPIGSTAGGVTMAGTAAVRSYRENQTKKIIRLLTEVDLKTGLMIQAISKQYGVPSTKITEIISAAEAKNIFCSNSDNLYSYGDIISYLTAEAQK